MNLLLVVLLLALIGLGFNQPLLWLAAAALVFFIFQQYDRAGSKSGSGSGSGSGGSSGGGGVAGGNAGGGGGGGYPKTYRDYRLRKERQERWDRRYRRTHPGSGR
ncbi:hypothetical protein OG453_12720 [Streptomyces sp. NBC_01381]|uniref:hypothetical protein n=1 Tax=Streptomyces sp. NBC_01381 TaxID=2903845 RepID=UPI0022559C87|nr:hypothetical protein [Streptomyces sp. NBC_01381]MCX4667516.1 hypothetical protein [Streptomyces sp. NBC_01381]